MKRDYLWLAVQRLNSEARHFRRIRASLEGSTPQEALLNRFDRVRNEKEFRTALDAACQHWIEHGKWPQMSRLHAMLIADRIGEGILAGAFLWHYGLRFEKKTEAEALVFLLIDCWAAFGRKAEIARLLSLPEPMRPT